MADSETLIFRVSFAPGAYRADTSNIVALAQTIVRSSISMSTTHSGSTAS